VDKFEVIEKSNLNNIPSYLVIIQMEINTISLLNKNIVNSMIQISNKNQNNKIELLSNGLDKLLSDKYILAKDIRDLNRTLQESNDTLNILEDKIKDKLDLKEQLEQYIKKVDAILTEPGLPASMEMMIKELIEKFNLESELVKMVESIKKENGDFIRVKQLLIDNVLNLTHEINDLREKTDSRINVNSEVTAERDHMKLQLKNIEEEIADYKRREAEEK